MDPNEMRFRAQHSPRSDATTMNSLISPQRNRLSQTFQPQQHFQQHQSAQDPRSNLSRRFTTDSGRVPTLSSNIGGPRGPDEYQSLQALALIDKKRLEFEKIVESKRLFAAEMQKHEQETSRLYEAEIQKQDRELKELTQMVEEHRLVGHQSEPTTPPEYRETTTGFPTSLSRPNANRYSLSSLQSPPGMLGRTARSGSILASPQSNVPTSRFAFDDQLPPWSQQTSRRNSDEDEKEEAVRQDPTSHRATNAVNRYSMPVTKSRGAFYDIDNLDQANTTSFLFRDDESALEGKSHTQTTTDDNFSTLLRQSNMSTVGSETSTTGARPASFRHSTEMKNVDQQKYGEAVSDAPNSGVNGHSGVIVSPSKGLPSSFSTGDVPTMKQVTGTSNHAAQQHLHNHNASMGRFPTSYHNHKLSTDGRNPNAAPGYQPIGSILQGDSNAFVPTMNQTTVQGTTFAVPAPQTSVGNGLIQVPLAASSFGNSTYYNGGAYPTNSYVNASHSYGNALNGNGNAANGYGGSPAGYNGNAGPVVLVSSGALVSPSGSSGSINGTSGSMSSLLNLMQNTNLSGNNGYSSGNGFSPASGYASSDYSSYANGFLPAPPRDNQARVIHVRRQQDNEAMNKYSGRPLSAFGGQIYSLCKDQHGCRYLQKQLESRDRETVRMIWLETVSHVIELMTDPFGNYLCQKLFELCTDQERTDLVRNASLDMVGIAVNQHGTRALQRMIESFSTGEQVQMLIDALTGRVVELIEDLNGNHVIQKCLNKLDSNDAQFIFDAVSSDCVTVGTHRHGCCVLQRCIDHAEGDHKQNLIAAITEHAGVLVQDPFGNYVIQYIIDLNEPMFTNPMVVKFLDNTVELSCHKFSSNVVEKCLRCASDAFKDMIVDRLLLSGSMADLVRDSFGNYVIQTAIEHATPAMKQRLVDAIRPMLPAIKTTAFGRKIGAKIASYDSSIGLHSSRLGSNQQTPADSNQGQYSVRPVSSRGNFHRNGNNGSNGMVGANNGNRDNAQAFIPSSDIKLPAAQQGMRSQPYGALQRAQKPDGLDDVLQRGQDSPLTSQRAQQGQNYTSPQRVRQIQDVLPASQHAQQSQSYVPAQRAQQNQDFVLSPQHTQHYTRHQQPLSRFASYAPRNGSPNFNGTAVNGASSANGIPAQGTPAHGTPAHGTPAHGTPAHGTPAHGTPVNGTPAPGMSPNINGYNGPGVSQNGDGTFF